MFFTCSCKHIFLFTKDFVKVPTLPHIPTKNMETDDTTQNTDDQNTDDDFFTNTPSPTSFISPTNPNLPDFPFDDDAITGDTTHILYLGITCVSNLITVFVICLLVHRMSRKRQLAHDGHTHVLDQVLLPAYEYLLVIMAVLFAIVALGDILMIVHMGVEENSKDRDVLLTIQVSAVCLMGIYSIVPVLLLQRSLAMKSYANVVKVIGSWWVVNFVIALFLVNNFRCLRDNEGVKMEYLCEDIGYHETLEKVFAFLSAFPPLLLHLCSLLGIIRSRIERR